MGNASVMTTAAGVAYKALSTAAVHRHASPDDRAAGRVRAPLEGS